MNKVFNSYMNTKIKIVSPIIIILLIWCSLFCRPIKAATRLETSGTLSVDNGAQLIVSSSGNAKYSYWNTNKYDMTWVKSVSISGNSSMRSGNNYGRCDVYLYGTSGTVITSCNPYSYTGSGLTSSLGAWSGTLTVPATASPSELKDAYIQVKIYTCSAYNGSCEWYYIAPTISTTVVPKRGEIIVKYDPEPFIDYNHTIINSYGGMSSPATYTATLGPYNLSGIKTLRLNGTISDLTDWNYNGSCYARSSYTITWYDAYGTVISQLSESTPTNITTNPTTVAKLTDTIKIDGLAESYDLTNVTAKIAMQSRLYNGKPDKKDAVFNIKYYASKQLKPEAPQYN